VREKKYRPLSFTAKFGWRVTPEGRLALSLGRGRDRPEHSRRRPAVTVAVAVDEGILNPMTLTAPADTARRPPGRPRMRWPGSAQASTA
jgi:hypothetical protein